MVVLKRLDPIFNLNDELDLTLLNHIIDDPILTKREKRITKFYLTKINSNLSEQEIINKIAMYFGYKRKTVLHTLITLQEFYDGICERAIDKTYAECERIEKEPSPA